MEILFHEHHGKRIAEVKAEKIVIHNAEGGLDLLGNLYYQQADAIILRMENITPEFFDLKNGMAVELLQKFSNYRVQLVIVGDFSGLTKQSIRDFIHESNNGKLVNFLPTVEEALTRLKK